MKYDVFISCKSEDYPYAEQVHSFLESNGVNVFLASKELRALGRADYSKAIFEAISKSRTMIVFASKAEYIDSEWVSHEWTSFIAALHNGHKGQIMTILKDVKVTDINWALLPYESFKYDDYEKYLLPYVTPRQTSSPSSGQSGTTAKVNVSGADCEFCSATAYRIRPKLVRLSNALVNATKSMYLMFEELNASSSFNFAPQQSVMSELMAALSEASHHLPDGLFNSIYQYAIEVVQKGYNWVLAQLREEVKKTGSFDCGNVEWLTEMHSRLVNEVVNLEEAQARLRSIVSDINKYMSWL